MGSKDDDKVAICPYCGSDKLTAIDWGFADWECETCSNNFRSPSYRYNSLPKSYADGGSNGDDASANPAKDTILRKIGNSLEEYCCLILLVLAVIYIVIFFAVRLFQIVIVPFL